MKRRVVDLTEQVMVAIGQRGAAVAETETRVGEALRELSEIEGLSLGEAVEWRRDRRRQGGNVAAAARLCRR